MSHDIGSITAFQLAMDFPVRFTAQVLLAVPPPQNPEISEASALLCRRMVLTELVRIVRGAYRDERFAMPTLFVFGTEDIVFPPHIARRVFENSDAFGADVRLTFIDGAAHYIIDEDPDATVPVIADCASV